MAVCERLWMIMLAYDGKFFLHTMQDRSPASELEQRLLASICLELRCCDRRIDSELFDSASSVSVCMFCTCRTHSAGVTKYIEQRSHRSAAVFSTIVFYKSQTAQYSFPQKEHSR